LEPRDSTGATSASAAVESDDRVELQGVKAIDAKAIDAKAIDAKAVIDLAARRACHPAALTREERYTVLETLCSEAFCDLPPAQVFTRLLDEGTYLCSVRTMYRILTEHGLTGERRRGGHQTPGRYPIPVVHATRPNEAWTWDVTKLRGPAKGVLYFLYTILDIYSRKIVGWTLATRESEHIARELIKTTIEREGVPEGQLTLHADRGGPMISGTVAELLDSLNVRKSHNRPRVSNDNPFVESSYKTMKYRPDYPNRFEGLQAARAWCRGFFAWYNSEHYHSGIAFLTPAVLHAGQHHDVLERRQATLERAYAQNPHHFTKPPKPADPPKEAWINRPTIQTN
jgi:putative transposase